jgi:peptidoglycan/xylan/chitin deacetylase (PgdA/CDA1 family)/2-polyprenyl-3-methyl-5-hydroxy-6-metoxy-1,4-benzoquinol methylase
VVAEFSPPDHVGWLGQSDKRDTFEERHIKVSVIIPAHNAAETIAETLESLRAQTYSHWEGIVVDDGSSDGTAAIVTCFTERDSRIRVVSGPQQGVSAARNTGIGLARGECLLFLDADDWLLPHHLERMTEVLIADPDLAAVHCGSARVALDGTWVGEEACLQAGDMFTTFARLAAFPIHACLVRRCVVEAVGGFDPSFRTCEEWDLWQRIARTGLRFEAIPDTLALYRMRPASASMDAGQMLTDGLRVLTLGHSPDPRVSHPTPAYAQGLPPADLPGRKLYFACWPAGLVLGSGGDARPLLEILNDARDPEFDPNVVATVIFRAALLPTCRTPAAWMELWPGLEERFDEFLQALEVQAQAMGLARRAHTIFERLILEHSTAPRPLTLGATHGVRVEVTAPLPDLQPPATIERLHCIVELEGEHLGTLELPICDGFVPSQVLADAITAQFAWLILGRFFERTLYPDFCLERESEGLSLRRDDLCLAVGLPEAGETFWSQAHDLVGWTVFLQEIWGRPNWPEPRFYDPEAVEEMAAQRYATDGWLVVEVSEDTPDVEVLGEELNVVLTVGGVPLGIVTIPAEQKYITAQTLRAALTTASGLELCRAAVREGLLGRPLTEPASLRARLAAKIAQGTLDGIAVTAVPALTLNLDGVSCGLLTVPALAPGSANALNRALSIGQGSVIFGRHSHGRIGTSASRRAMLPMAAVREIREAAMVAGELVIEFPGPEDHPERVVYAPDLLWRSFGRLRVSPGGVSGRIGDRANVTQLKSTAVFNSRSNFETIFAAQSDPWHYTSQYEQTKYEQTLELLPPVKIKQALELACAEGHFTAQLAPRVGSLIATDISQIALDRAAKRCAGLENIRFIRLDLTKDSLAGRFDLIVCSEVLYYVGGLEELRGVACRLADALEPGGYLLTAHANLIVDEPDQTGFDWGHPFGAKVIGETLASVGSLRLVKELRMPLYRIQLFQRESRLRLSFQRRTPQVIELPQPAPLPPHIAETVRWHGGNPWPNEMPQVATTDRLAILMYHRVAPAGSATTARYRVTPEAFETQIQYLHDAGFYSVSLEEWQMAMETKKPLLGRAVLITFDDGYLDFLTYAWPVLKRYGFSATVFLVADEVGRSNSWDHVYREEVPLLGWVEIQQLQDEGVDFGSHSASHRHLTALSPTEIVQEGARSRAILERKLERRLKAFAYPYGDTDPVVQHLIGACGYNFGLSCRPDLSRFQDSLLDLPRLEVTGFDNLSEFVAKVGS